MGRNKIAICEGKCKKIILFVLQSTSAEEEFAWLARSSAATWKLTSWWFSVPDILILCCLPSSYKTCSNIDNARDG